MSYATRQLRVRLLEALTQRSRSFRTRHDLWPMRVPAEPLLLDEVMQEALGPERRLLDERDLKSRSLLTFEWRDETGALETRWEAWVLALPSGINLYCDSNDGESRILGSAKRDAEGGGM